MTMDKRTARILEQCAAAGWSLQDFAVVYGGASAGRKYTDASHDTQTEPDIALPFPAAHRSTGGRIAYTARSYAPCLRALEGTAPAYMSRAYGLMLRSVLHAASCVGMVAVADLLGGALGVVMVIIAAANVLGIADALRQIERIWQAEKAVRLEEQRRSRMR